MIKFTSMKKRREITKFLTILLFSIAFALIFKWWTTGNPFHSSTLLFGTIILLISLISLFLGNKFFSRFLNIPIKQLKKRIIPAFILFLLVILLMSLIIIGLSIYIYHRIMGLDTTNFINTLFEVEFPGTIKYYLICVLIVSSFFFYNIWRQAIDREQKLQEENLRYQYRTLKTQVNPHFLFNSLNTLSEIIYTDTKRADNYIQKLAGVYRYILDNEETNLISLSSEIRFVKQYFELQKERNDDKIQLNIDIENADKFKIIPVSLQILVENALKHNLISEEQPLIIHIYNEVGYIVVSNTIQKKNVLHNSSGIGLPNLKERIKLITGKEIMIHQENNQFIVKLPVINI